MFVQDPGLSPARELLKEFQPIRLLLSPVDGTEFNSFAKKLFIQVTEWRGLNRPREERERTGVSVLMPFISISVYADEFEDVIAPLVGSMISHIHLDRKIT